MGGTATTAGVLDGVLRGLGSGSPGTSGPADPQLSNGSSIDDIMSSIVEAVRPTDGTQDTEAARASVSDALSELLDRFPDAELLDLKPDERAFAIERYVASDVSRRFELDVGKAILEKTASAVTALSRLKEARDYVREAVSASFRKLREAGRTLTSGRVAQVVRDALRETFLVFSGYAE